MIEFCFTFNLLSRFIKPRHYALFPFFSGNHGELTLPTPIPPPLPRGRVMNLGSQAVYAFMSSKCLTLVFHHFENFKWHRAGSGTLFFYSLFSMRSCREEPGLGTWPPGGRRLLVTGPCSDSPRSLPWSPGRPGAAAAHWSLRTAIRPVVRREGSGRVGSTQGQGPWHKMTNREFPGT